MKDPKTSKTLWANIIAIVALVVQSKTGYLASLEDQAIALGFINLILRIVTKDQLDWSQVKKTPFIALLIIPLIGCAGMNFEKHEIAMELAVRATTARVLENNPGWSESAYNITADVIKKAEAGEFVCLKDLERAVIGRIPWAEITPEEQVLALLLIGTVRSDLESYLEHRGVKTPGDFAVSVAKVLSWVNQTAGVTGNFN
jgi:hypothetical protein